MRGKTTWGLSCDIKVRGIDGDEVPNCLNPRLYGSVNVVGRSTAYVEVLWHQRKASAVLRNMPDYMIPQLSN